MSKKYVVSCDPATEDPIMYTFVCDTWFEVKLDKNISRMKKIDRILKDYSAE
jgi:hypothetical protein